MTHNELDPGFVKLYYTSNGHNHIEVLPTEFAGTPVAGVKPDVVIRSGSPIPVDTALTAFWTIQKTLYKATDTLVSYECYTQVADADPEFFFGDDLAIVGTNGGTSNLAGQLSTTFRTAGGHILRILVMEGVHSLNTKVPSRVTGAGYIGLLATYILGNTNWIIGRDGTMPIAGAFQTTKTNDALRKKYILNV